MGSLVLVPWAETPWTAANRLAGRTPLPLTEQGQATVRSWAEKMAQEGLSKIYLGPEQTSKEVAAQVAACTGASQKVLPDLAEVGMGLWEGLTPEELKHRYPKLLKAWLSNPTSVSVPEGEDLEDASNRLRAPLETICRKCGDGCVAVVLGSTSFGLVRCQLEGADLTETLARRHDEPLCYKLDADGVSVRATDSTNSDAIAPASVVNP